MLSKEQLLRPLAEQRTDEVVVATMSVVRPWGEYSDSPLDLASADSAMGHAADLALGIALAQPSRKVICLNGDGSMLMTLGTLVTIVEARADNLILFVIDNSSYEITGNLPVPGKGRVNFAALARAAGFGRVYDFDSPTEYERNLGELLTVPGPVFVAVQVETGSEGPIRRSPEEPARYLKLSLFDSCRVVRKALLASPSGRRSSGSVSAGNDPTIDPLASIHNFIAVNESLATAGQPTEQQLQAVRDAGYEVVINLGLLDPGYCLPDEAGLVKHLGMSYHHVPVRFQAPQAEDFFAFVRAMEAAQGRRTFVHCAANIRVSAFVSLYGLKVLGWSEERSERWACLLWQPDPVWRAFLETMRRPQGGFGS